MIKIFAPQIQIDCYHDWFITGINHKNLEFLKVTDINELGDQDIKIAAIPMHYEEYDPENKYNFNPADFDLCLISDVEASSYKVCQEWANEKGIKNYCLAVGSLEFVRLQDLPNDVIYRPWWMFNLLSCNELRQHDNSNNKPFNFDVLLGAKKQHRDFVMAKFQIENMLDSNIINYRPVFPGRYGTEETLDKHLTEILGPTQLMYPYISPNLNPEWEVCDNITRSVSSMVPWKIFDKTKYSVICETNYERGFFATEKIGKAIIGNRLFVVFSAPHFLQNLHDIGFKTFDTIINENYDAEANIVTRFEMAFEQIKWLSSQDYHSIMNRAMPIIEHNKKHLVELHQKTKQAMLAMVYNKLKEIKKC